MNTILNIKDMCCGCGACANICPAGAIKMNYQEMNFYMPKVNEEKCIKCGKCLKVCPAIKYDSKNRKEPICYAVSASDEERQQSTSGAVFPIIAKYVLSQGGYVCGVAWDKNWNAHHIIINDENELKKLRFSKYIQAITGDSFKNIKNLLDDNRLVLFSGTPCQNAGLLKFLGKEYENLITIDLLCHGTPSPKVWQDYLEQNFNKEEIVNINFRKKEGGWVRCGEAWYSSSSSSSIDCANGNKTPIGIFYEAFINHVLSNDVCLECKYRAIPRPGDFTLGDFWYLYNNEELNDKKGLSVVLLNNKKAESIFKKVSPFLRLYKEVNLEEHYERIELCTNSRRSKKRELFFQKYKENNFDINKLLNASVGKHYDVGLLTQFNGMNYGSALVAYAANKIISDLGYSVLMINKSWIGDSNIENNFEHNNNLKFAQEHYFISQYFDAVDDHRNLNNMCDTFITGSDTLWWDTKPAGNFYFLDFATSDKKKIAFCTSFAFDKPEISPEKQREIKYLLNRFDAIATREESGVDILKNNFEYNNAISLYDPTLISRKETWLDLANNSNLNIKDYILVYILDMNIRRKLLIDNFIKKYNKKVIFVDNPYINYEYYSNSTNANKKNYKVEDFVYLLKNAEYVITDSFHGTCFSIIFEKKFVSIANQSRGGARYKIFKDMNLSHRIINTYEGLETFNLDDDINYEVAKNIIKSEREKAIEWLQTQINKQKKETTQSDLLFDYITSKQQEEISKQKNELFAKENIIKQKNYRYSLLENLFSVRNEFSNGIKRKVITILGIKIKFKIYKFIR